MKITFVIWLEEEILQTDGFEEIFARIAKSSADLDRASLNYIKEIR